MGVSVNKLSSNNIGSISTYSANYHGNSNGNDSDVYMAGMNSSAQYQHKPSNGKFRMSKAFTNFCKGLVSPITSMFSSPKNFLVGTGMIAGSVALIAATGGAAAPILVAAGVGMGTFQAGKAVYEIASAKTSKDIENAFYDIGGATSTIGLSVWGAKPALKQAGMATDDLGFLGSIKKCFTSAKELTKESYDVFASGYYKTNLAHAKKLITTPKILKQYSSELYQEGCQNYAQSFEGLKNALPEKLRPYLRGRSKCELSIYEKMSRRFESLDNEIQSIRENPEFSEADKKHAIRGLLHEKMQIKKDPKFAKSYIEDLLGARLALEDVSAESIDEIVASLSDSIKKGDIELLEIENYRGANKNYEGETQFYFSEDQVKKLREAAGLPIEKFASKKSGYTAVQLKIKPRGCKVLELQIRGKHVDEFADIEHLPYDLSQGKDVSKGNNQLGILLSPIQKAVKGLSKEQLHQYNQYIYENYVYSQHLEFGIEATKPKLPEGIDPVLSSENLLKVFHQSKNLTAGRIKNPLLIYSQLPFITGTTSLSN